MDRQLAAIVAIYQSAHDRLQRLLASVRPAQWAVRPAATSWSVAECVAHLNLTSRAYLPLLRTAVEEARSLGPSQRRRYRRDPLGWLFSIATGPLPGIGALRLGRAQTTAPFVPGGELPRASVVVEFDLLQDEQVALVRACAGLPMDQVWITSPFISRFRYNAYSCLVILPRHQHRHLAQAERALRTLEGSQAVIGKDRTRGANHR